MSNVGFRGVLWNGKPITEEEFIKNTGQTPDAYIENHKTYSVGPTPGKAIVTIARIINREKENE